MSFCREWRVSANISHIISHLLCRTSFLPPIQTFLNDALLALHRNNVARTSRFLAEKGMGSAFDAFSLQKEGMSGRKIVAFSRTLRL
jgi:hypothetical protein